MRKDRYGMDEELRPYSETEKTVEVYGCPALNVRKEPQKRSDVLEVVHEGAKLKVIKAIPNWYQVETENGTTGYVMAEYTKEV